MSASQTVHVVSHDRGLRQTIVSTVTAAGIEAVEYESADSLLASRWDSQPSCVVVEQELPGTTGLELLRILHERCPSVGVILVAAEVSAQAAVQAIRDGAHDILEKPVPPQNLLAAVQEALAKTAKRWMIDSARRRIHHRIEALSNRERQVMHLLAVGKQTKTIAADLGVSPKTVEHHRPKILTKMGVDNVVELSQVVTLAHGVSLDTAIQSLRAD